MAVANDPARRRPELIYVGPADHVELGSAIRSAAALGWGRVFVEDRASVWFGVERLVRAEGRAAARRHKNAIRIAPLGLDSRLAFYEVCVVTTGRAGIPIHRANLARGPRQGIVIPDETALELAGEDWSRFGATVKLVRLDLASTSFPYHYRHVASIALAEVARQVGRPAPKTRAPGRHGPLYDRSLELLATDLGETVELEDLAEY